MKQCLSLKFDWTTIAQAQKQPPASDHCYRYTPSSSHDMALTACLNLAVKAMKAVDIVAFTGYTLLF